MMTELRAPSLLPTEPSLENETKKNLTSIDFIIERLTPEGLGVTLVLCLFGLIANGVVLWFLGFRIKRNPFTVYILNLAAADFAYFLCLGLLLTIYNVRHLFPSLGILYSNNSFCLLLLFTYSTSLYLLTAISTERCVSVLFPIWHRCRRPKHLSAAVCALLWALSCLLTGLASYDCVWTDLNNCYMMLTPLSAVNFLIFAPIMVVSSLTLVIKVQSSSQRRQPGKLYILILLTVLFFLFFATPFSIGIFLQNFYNPFKLTFITVMQASINSIINPVIYFLVGSYRNRQFRGSIKHALQRVFEDKADSREERDRCQADIAERRLQFEERETTWHQKAWGAFMATFNRVATSFEKLVYKRQE
ncbi:mas-related G-protein coupled receptor member H-like [Carettochelys insculpta]|uniref:mas-related G-protein coupled receptor member H-like n=1 Tax=Carettochelys insculpta TaxID=44489 RepID=UPI003EBDA2CA